MVGTPKNYGSKCSISLEIGMENPYQAKDFFGTTIASKIQINSSIIHLTNLILGYGSVCFSLGLLLRNSLES